MTCRTTPLLLTALTIGAGLATLATVPSAPGQEVKAVTAANTQFALDLHGQFRDKPGNLFYSPLSISAALAMTSLGARGETLAELNNALHLPETGDAHAAFGTLLRGLHGTGKKYELHIANALWGQQGFPFREQFLSLTQKHYGAGLRQVDFAASEQARATINRWVEEQTKDKIKDLLPPNSIDALTRLVLTNAIYFKGDWERKFSKDMTRDEPFKLAGGQTVNVPLMRIGGMFPYFEGDGLQAVSLPYAGGELALVVLLPRAADGLPALERSINPAKLNEWLSHMQRRDGDVLLPRFKVTSEFDLQATLQALGVKTAFDDRRADFSGMTDVPEKLAITKVVHKAYVDVNEEGSEAAAATGVVVGITSAPAQPVQRFTFRADHPFLFLIRDLRSGSVLFFGRVANPAS